MNEECSATKDFLIPGNIKFEVDANGCWICSRAKNRDGYPQILANGKHMNVARFVFMTLYGPIPEGLVIRHQCDNRQCINPDHLKIGTHADNVADRVERGRSAIGENHGRSKLTEEDISFIRNDGDHNNAELARMFGVDRKAIRKVKQGITWKHVA